MINTNTTRIAVMEQRLRFAEDILKERTDALNNISSKLDKIMSEQARYKGFFGGLLFAGSAIFTLFKLFGAFIAAKFFG